MSHLAIKKLLEKKNTVKPTWRNILEIHIRKNTQTSGSTKSGTVLACSCNQGSLEAELKTREEELDLFVLLIRNSSVPVWLELIFVIRYCSQNAEKKILVVKGKFCLTIQVTVAFWPRGYSL